MEQISLLMTDLAPEVTKQCTAALSQRGVKVTVCEKDGRKALAAADAAIQRLGAQVNPKITLSVLAARFRTF